MTWPLFDAYPALAKTLAPLRLCELPSPVTRLAGIDSNSWVKRDDAIHPEYGGNKMRKLEFVAAELKRRGIRRVYTLGGTGTNFGVAAALICRDLGIALTVFTFDQPLSPHVLGNQILMHRYGASLRHCGHMLAAGLIWHLHPRRFDRLSYFLEAGAANTVSTFAYINAAFELHEQIRRGECPEPAQIYVPVGSSSTLAGLTLGCRLAGLATEVVGIRVAPASIGPIAVCTPAVSLRLMRSAAALMAQHGYSVDDALAAPVLVDDCYGSGYGCSTDVAEAAIDCGNSLGLTLEATYSGKAFAAFLARTRETAQPLLFWATFNSRGER